MKLKGRPATIAPEKVTQIYALYDTGEYGYKRIGKMLDISWTKVLYYIRKRRKENAAEINQQHSTTET